MEITNLKYLKVLLICRFAPKENTNHFPIFGIRRVFNFAKENWLWIGVVLFFGFIGSQLVLDVSFWNAFMYYRIGILQYALLGILLFILAGCTWGKSGPSGRTRITRHTSGSVDGFGGVRGLDYSHAAAGGSGKGPLPVSLRIERKRTATFRDGEKDWLDEADRKKKKKR